MTNFLNSLIAVFRAPPEDHNPPDSQSNSYREVIALQAILVTLIVALLAYLQKEPAFQLRVDVTFVFLAAVPIMGLYHICCGRSRVRDCEIFVYTQPVRTYARRVFFLAVIIVAAVCILYWRGQLPGQ